VTNFDMQTISAIFQEEVITGEFGKILRHEVA
jgi:hypothetical protein